MTDSLTLIGYGIVLGCERPWFKSLLCLIQCGLKLKNSESGREETWTGDLQIQYSSHQAPHCIRVRTHLPFSPLKFRFWSKMDILTETHFCENFVFVTVQEENTFGNL